MFGGAAGLRELGYAQITADQTTTSTSYVDITGLSLTGLVQGSKVVVVKFYCAFVQNGSAQNVVVALTSSDNATSYGEATMFTNTTFASVPVALERRFAVGALPSAIKARFKVSGGTGKIGATAPIAPAFLVAYEAPT